jgi:hypothetical protein
MSETKKGQPGQGLKEQLAEIKDITEEIEVQLRFFPQTKDRSEKTELYLRGMEVNAQRILEAVAKVREQA